MSEKTLRKILTEECIKEGYNVDDETLEEILREHYEVVHFYDKSSHRWRDETWNISKIHGRFFKYSGYHNTGDLDAEGCGYCFEGIDSVTEVFRKERVIKEVYYE